MKHIFIILFVCILFTVTVFSQVEFSGRVIIYDDEVPEFKNKFGKLCSKIESSEYPGIIFYGASESTANAILDDKDFGDYIFEGNVTITGKVKKVSILETLHTEVVVDSVFKPIFFLSWQIGDDFLYTKTTKTTIKKRFSGVIAISVSGEKMITLPLAEHDLSLFNTLVPGDKVQIFMKYKGSEIPDEVPIKLPAGPLEWSNLHLQ